MTTLPTMPTLPTMSTIFYRSRLWVPVLHLHIPLYHYRVVELPRDSNTDSGDDGGYDDGDVTSSQLSMIPDPPSPKSVATTSQRSSHLVPVTSSHRTMSSNRTTAMQTAAMAMIAMEGEVIHPHSGLWAPVYLLTLHHGRRMIRL